MKNGKQKEGFAAYEEIQALAFRVYGKVVSVQAQIFGNGYEIFYDQTPSSLLHKGTSQEVRFELNQKLEKSEVA